MNNPKDKCIECNGTGEGETKVYKMPSIEHEGENWMRSIDHESLVALARQEQREEMGSAIRNMMQTFPSKTNETRDQVWIFYKNRCKEVEIHNSILEKALQAIKNLE